MMLVVKGCSEIGQRGHTGVAQWHLQPLLLTVLHMVGGGSVAMTAADIPLRCVLLTQ